MTVPLPPDRWRPGRRVRLFLQVRERQDQVRVLHHLLPLRPSGEGRDPRVQSRDRRLPVPLLLVHLGRVSPGVSGVPLLARAALQDTSVHASPCGALRPALAQQRRRTSRGRALLGLRGRRTRLYTSFLDPQLSAPLPRTSCCGWLSSWFTLSLPFPGHRPISLSFLCPVTLIRRKRTFSLSLPEKVPQPAGSSGRGDRGLMAPLLSSCHFIFTYLWGLAQQKIALS